MIRVINLYASGLIIVIFVLVFPSDFKMRDLISVFKNSATTEKKSSTQNQHQYIISGSLQDSPQLYLLDFDQIHKTLTVVEKINGDGPHQYIHYNKTSRRIYATSLDQKPHLSAWSIKKNDDSVPEVKMINRVPSWKFPLYITTRGNYIYSVGTVSGRIHQIDLVSGGFGEELKELSYGERIEPKENPENPLSSLGLSTGSHAIEFSTKNQAFVTHMGRNSIWFYNLDDDGYSLNLIKEIKSYRNDDAPRHCIASEDGEWLYVVTEHSQRVDVYKTHSSDLSYRSSALIIEPGDDPSSYRGDTVRLSPVTGTGKQYIFATTRGKSPSIPGYLSVFEHESGSSDLRTLLRWKTPTSGGGANAIEFRETSEGEKSVLVLTDSEVGWIFVLQWDPIQNSIEILAKCLVDEVKTGASIAVWL